MWATVWGGVQRCQDIQQLSNMFRIYDARVVLFKTPLQAPVADCPYHPTTAVTHVYRKLTVPVLAK